MTRRLTRNRKPCLCEFFVSDSCRLQPLPSSKTSNKRKRSQQSQAVDISDDSDTQPSQRSATKKAGPRKYQSALRALASGSLGESLIECARLKSEDFARELDFKMRQLDNEEKRAEKAHLEKMQQLESQNLLLRLRLAQLTKQNE